MPDPPHDPSNPPFSSAVYWWKLNDATKTLEPIVAHMTNFLNWLADRQEDDFRVRFIFHQSYNAPDVYIQQSRLEWARGPFAALVKPPFVEAKSRQVQLCEADDPKSFAILLKFLNGVQVPLANIEGGVHTLLAVIRSAHRWDLSDLFRGVCLYLSSCKMLQLTDHLIDAADVAVLPGIEAGFVEYFWACVGDRFKEFRSVDGYRVYATANGGVTTEKAEAIDVPIQVHVCPRFPKLWELVLEQGVTHTVLKAAVVKEDDEFKEELLQVVLLYMEPKLNDDAAILDLLALFELRDWDYCDKVLNDAPLDSKCSVRAMRLLGKALVDSFRAYEDQLGKRKRYTYLHESGKRYTVRRRPWQDRDRRRLVEIMEEDAGAERADSHPYRDPHSYGNAYRPDPYRSEPFLWDRYYDSNFSFAGGYSAGPSRSNGYGVEIRNPFY